jgi:phenylpyruvate tautomerase PptA (4-oxalocrotonate tautomerase family)
MPLYTVVTQSGVLTSEDKAMLAEDLTTFHSEYSGVPKNWVHIVFIGIHEVPASQAMEMGKLMPEVEAS